MFQTATQKLASIFRRSQTAKKIPPGQYNVEVISADSNPEMYSLLMHVMDNPDKNCIVAIRDEDGKLQVVEEIPND